MDGTRLSGTLDAALAQWRNLTFLRLSGTRVSGIAPELFRLPGVQLIDLSQTKLPWLGALCPFAAQTALIDVSYNAWGVSVRDAVECFAGNSSLATVAELRMSNMALSGMLQTTLLARRSSVTRLHLGDNMLACDIDSPVYSLATPLEYLDISANPRLAGCYAIDYAPLPRQSNVSGTAALFCYEGALLASSGTAAASLRGVRPWSICRRTLAQDVMRVLFSDCRAPATGMPDTQAAAAVALNSTLCTLGDMKVAFTDSGLTCPSWSTFPSAGRARLDVDAAFLAFWGCVCPPDHYWGYASEAALASEEARFAAAWFIGEQEATLQARACLPCPPGLPVRCSPLAVVDAPHVVTQSAYPLPQRDGRQPRSRLPYLTPRSLLPCLHPAVCGSTRGFVDDWATWAPLAANGTAATAAFADFQCREGHDAAAPLCSGCLRGYWLDGFLCRRCVAGAEALVVLGSLAALGLLVFAVRRQLRMQADGVRTTASFGSIILWFFQVSHTLQVSQQINAAQRGSSLSQDAGGLAALLPVLSFRPWALQCLIPGWNLTTASVLLFATAWVLAGATVTLRKSSWRRAVVLVMDMMYLPVSQRAILWLNQRSFGEKVWPLLHACCVRALTRLFALLQCVLQLAPDTLCSAGMTAFAAVTLAAFAVGAPLAVWVLLARNSMHPMAAHVVQPYSGWARWLWAVPLRFGRKLWFAALLGAWDFSDPSRAGQLALVIFASLLVMLIVQLYGAFYAEARDNGLEVACLLLLLYGYFVSTLPDASDAMLASVTTLQVALVGYGLYCWGRDRAAHSANASAPAPASDELGVALLQPEADGEDRAT
jgi:hypothetical protein